MVPSPPSTTAMSTSVSPSAASSPCFSASSAATSSSTPPSRATFASRARADPIACGLPCVITAARLTALDGCDCAVDSLVDVIEEDGIGAVDQMDEELVVPLRSWQPGVYDADCRPTPVEGCFHDRAEDTAVDRGVSDDTA